jgi:tetratricopeptide (TPR) repeat protein
LGDAQGALANFEEALRLCPNFADAYSNRGAVRAELGDLAGAEADCQQALAKTPASGTFHARRGAMLHKQKDFPAALAAYDRAILLNPCLYWAYILRGNARYHSGDWRGLCADYQKAFALQADKSARLVLRTLLPDSNALAALTDCENHLHQTAGDPVSYARRGLLFLLMQREDQAAKDFEYCRRLYPDAAPYMERLITLARTQGHRARAASASSS